MTNTIKNYLSTRSNRICTDYWYKETLIEIVRMRCELVSYEIFCFDKKKLTLHKKCRNRQLDCNTNEILDSYMVIIRTCLFEKNIVMKMLGQICKDTNCFGAIAFSEDNDILFFPKLRYQDGYLLKSILEKQLNNKNFCIAFGSNDLVVI
ncbi:MAG: hypothetical protein AB9836_06975 [Aminipila sp.]